MGMSLSIELGLGVEIPIEDNGIDPKTAAKVISALEPNPDFITEIEEYDDEVYISYDDYEIFDTLNKKFPLLSFEQSYSSDYSTGAAIFVKRLSSAGYYGSATLNPYLLTPTEDEVTQLQEALKIFDLEEELKIIALPSYG